MTHIRSGIIAMRRSPNVHRFGYLQIKLVNCPTRLSTSWPWWIPLRQTAQKTWEDVSRRTDSRRFNVLLGA